MESNDARLVIAGVVLLRNDGAALLQLRDNKPGLSAAGQWVFPGGHCECGETIPDCARREFREETSYDCPDLKLLTSFPYRSPDTGAVFQLNFFWSQYDERQAIHCYEGQEIRFLQRNTIAALPMPDYVPGVSDWAIQTFQLDQKKTLRLR